MKVRKIAIITEFNIRQFAWMVTKMRSLREGDGTLLDSCIMMWGSGLEDGNVHTRENLPFVIAGNGRRFDPDGTVLRKHQGKSGRFAHHTARLRRRSERPARWDRDEADRGTQGSGVTNTSEPRTFVRGSDIGNEERSNGE